MLRTLCWGGTSGDACAAVVVLVALSLLPLLAAGGDYATLRALRTNDASQVSTFWNAYQVSVDEQKQPRLLRLSARQPKVVAYAALCAGAGGDEQLPPNHLREFTFNDEQMLDPARTADYNFEVEYNCTTRDDGSPLHAAGELGIRSRDSPLWRVWTYATFAADEVRLGRAHPRNADARGEWSAKAANVFECSRSRAEHVCEFEAFAAAPGAFASPRERRRYLVDFEVDDSHIYVPHELYVNFTSVQWAHGVKVRRVEDWPSLVLVSPHDDRVHIALDARLFVPRSFELSFTRPSKAAEWPRFVSQLLGDSGVLVATSSSSPPRIVLGTRVLERYTLHKDYLGSRMLASHTPVVDHFHFAEMLMFIFIFVSYVAHKASSMEPIAFLLLGTWPRCHICGAVYIGACKRHRGVYAGLYMHYVVQGAVLVSAWFALAYDARLNNTSGNLLEVAVWAYTALGVASVAYVATAVIEWYCRVSWGLLAVRRLLIVNAAAFEAAASIGLFALASVVRGGDDLITALLFFMALVIVYDVLRRAFVVLYAFLWRYDLQFARPPPSVASDVFYSLYAALVVLGHGAVYSTYVQTRYVILPFVQRSATFTVIALAAALALAFTVTSTYVSHAMAANVRRTLERTREIQT